MFVIGEVAIVIEFLKFGGGGLGTGLAMLFQNDNFPGEASEDTQETRVLERVLGELLFEGNRGETTKQIIVLASNDLQGGLRQRGRVIVGNHFQSGFTIGADISEAFLAGEVFLITAIFPAGDIHPGNRVRQRRIGGLLEFLDDLAVRDAVIEHGVDTVAQNFGQLSDFAVMRLPG